MKIKSALFSDGEIIELRCLFHRFYCETVRQADGIGTCNQCGAMMRYYRNDPRAHPDRRFECDKCGNWGDEIVKG
jgi:hypothetical protein